MYKIKSIQVKAVTVLEKAAFDRSEEETEEEAMERRTLKAEVAVGDMTSGFGFALPTISPKVLVQHYEDAEFDNAAEATPAGMEDLQFALERWAEDNLDLDALGYKLDHALSRNSAGPGPYWAKGNGRLAIPLVEVNEDGTEVRVGHGDHLKVDLYLELVAEDLG